ncbi:hypothetical protein T11_9625 [Trichinella zimbabwensis]|uniref:Uncharacterized protein n=1 Tax=Trichinella zimbabwensis TaxID=268475 RepID=A0A0V1HGG2_9BILA|nr:hypothetical protein T11_9625 [Trichinella zimbabwensis]
METVEDGNGKHVASRKPCSGHELRHQASKQASKNLLTFASWQLRKIKPFNKEEFSYFFLSSEYNTSSAIGILKALKTAADGQTEESFKIKLLTRVASGFPRSATVNDAQKENLNNFDNRNISFLTWTIFVLHFLYILPCIAVRQQQQQQHAVDRPVDRENGSVREQPLRLCTTPSRLTGGVQLRVAIVVVDVDQPTD